MTSPLLSLLTSWTWGRTARAVDEALTSAGVGERDTVAVVDGPAVARVLAAGSRPLVLVGERGRWLERGDGVRARAAALPLADAALAGLVGLGAGEAGVWEALLAEWARVVRDGGAIVLVDRVAREETSRRALCAGLVDLEQRVAGRHVVTSGRVRRF